MPSHLTPDDAAAFARLSQELAAEPDTEQTVQRVVEQAQQSIPGCDYAGFTLTHKDRLETAAATDPVIGRLDQAQHDLGEGPCLEAARTEETYLIRDTTKEQRWPKWAATAAEMGVLSVLSVQLTGPNHLHAAMNLYSTRLDAYDEDAVITAQIYATHAGNAIAASNESRAAADGAADAAPDRGRPGDADDALRPDRGAVVPFPGPQLPGHQHQAQGRCGQAGGRAAQAALAGRAVAAVALSRVLEPEADLHGHLDVTDLAVL